MKEENDEHDYSYSILDDYLKTVLVAGYEPHSIEEGNMYLAEDRILCLKIYAKLCNFYTLKYIPSKFSINLIINLY